MIIRVALLTSAIFILLINVCCAGSQEDPDEIRARKHNIIIPSMKFVTPDDKKLWEGVIDGRVVTYFRQKKERGISDIIVSTQDSLPKYFKRIEYLDKGGDGNLDLVRMRIYEKAKGWRDIGITKDNKYGLRFADSQYKKLLEEIKKRGK